MKTRLFYILIVLVPLNLLSQNNKEELFNQRDKLVQDIALTNKLLESTQNKQGSTVQSIKLLNKKISKKSTLIVNYRAEVRIIEQKIIDREVTILSLQSDLKEQKELYANFLRYTYKNHNFYTKAVYLLASSSLNQFYLRRKYFEQLSNARVDKIVLISRLDEQINFEIEELNSSKIEIAEALIRENNESKLLSKTKNKREVILSDLSSEEKRLRSELKEKLRIENEIKRRIEDLIKAESKKNTLARLTPEEQLVSEDFARNRGKLPWPTRQGIITEKFGEHNHPVIKGVKVRNNGVDISTIDNSGVRVIFEGTVSKIFAIKGSNYTVIVKHGNYYTVYHNLLDIQVSVGEYVNTKDNLGVVGNSVSGDGSIVHFEIWKGLEKMNPESWISD